jgi:hypothetical protein
MWILVSVHSGTVLVLEQDSCTIFAKPTIAQKNFRTLPMVLLCYVAQVEARFVPFGHSANLDAR